MKILILSTGTSGGHDSAACALMERFEELGIECKKIDSRILTSRREASEKFDKKYNDLVIKIPNLFKVIFILGEMFSIFRIKTPYYIANRFFSNELKKELSNYIEENKFNVILASYMVPRETLTMLKMKNPNIHFVTICTDYACVPLWNEINPDYYIIPSKELINNFVRRGIERKKLIPYGIPVSPKYLKKIDKKDARRQLSLPINKKIVLIMTGSLGYGKLNSIIDEIRDSYQKEVHIVVICGNNNKLKESLEEQYKDNITVEGYTKGINIYMDACDVLLTKPGGLTITEAAVKNIPIIFTDPIPGWEENNLKFFKTRNMAYSIKEPNDLTCYLDLLLNNKRKIYNMRKSQSKYINKNATNDICKFIIKKYKNSNK